MRNAWVDFEGNLSTQPPLLGPECVVWVDAPAEYQYRATVYGGGVPYHPTTVDTAWYRPEGEWGPPMWIEARGTKGMRVR